MNRCLAHITSEHAAAVRVGDNQRADTLHATVREILHLWVAIERLVGDIITQKTSAVELVIGNAWNPPPPFVDIQVLNDTHNTLVRRLAVLVVLNSPPDLCNDSTRPSSATVL